MTIFLKNFLSLFYIETYHLLSISLFFAVANMASELSFFFMSDFYPRHKNFFLYIVFCFKLCVLKKVLNTEINGKSDILVDHEFHMVSFSLSIMRCECGYVHVYNLIYVLWKLKH